MALWSPSMSWDEAVGAAESLMGTGATSHTTGVIVRSKNSCINDFPKQKKGVRERSQKKQICRWNWLNFKLPKDGRIYELPGSFLEDPRWIERLLHVVNRRSLIGVSRSSQLSCRWRYLKLCEIKVTSCQILRTCICALLRTCQNNLGNLSPWAYKVLRHCNIKKLFRIKNPKQSNT